MLVSISLVTALILLLFFTNYHDVRKNNPNSNFRVPLWPTFDASHTIGKFLSLLCSPCCLQTALVILHSREKLTFKTGFIPIAWTLFFTFFVFFIICLPILYLYGELIIS